MSKGTRTEAELRQALDDYGISSEVLARRERRSRPTRSAGSGSSSGLVVSYKPARRASGRKTSSRDQPLHNHLVDQARCGRTFGQIERILDATPLDLVRKYRPWWAEFVR